MSPGYASEVEMTNCCNKSSRAEDAGKLECLNTRFRGVFTRIHMLVWLGWPPGKGWSGGLRAHRLLLPAKKVTGAGASVTPGRASMVGGGGGGACGKVAELGLPTGSAMGLGAPKC